MPIYYASEGSDVVISEIDLLGTPGMAYGSLAPVQSGVIPSFMRATALISETLAGLPFRRVVGDEMSDAPRWIGDPHLLRPDGRVGDGRRWPCSLSRVDFWSQVIVSMLWFGNAYVWVGQDTIDGPRPGFGFIKVLNPTRVDFDLDRGDWLIGGEYLEEVLGGRILHFRGLPPYDEKGMARGVLSMFGDDLSLADDIRNYATRTLKSGIPNGYLKVTNGNLTKPQADTLRDAWMATHGDARSIAVLNSSTDFTPLALSPLDMSLLEMKKASTQDIALMFGMDPTLLGAPSGSSSNYSNSAEKMQDFVTFTLRAWARRIEEVLSAEVPYGTNIEIDFRGLLRGDDKARSEFYASAITNGWMTVDEVRKLERLPHLELPAAPALPALPAEPTPALDEEAPQ